MSIMLDSKRITTIHKLKIKFKIMNIAILILCILIMAGIVTLGNNQIKITNNQNKIWEMLEEINKEVHR